MSDHAADQSSGFQIVDEFNANDSILQGNPVADQSSSFQVVDESGEITDSMLQGHPDKSIEDPQTYEQCYNQDIMNDYFLQQFDIATQLMLNLPNENDRITASRWLQFIMASGNQTITPPRALMIISSMILMMNANQLLTPINKPPVRNFNFDLLSEEEKSNLYAPRITQVVKNKKEYVRYESCADNTMYVATQRIDDYGTQFVFSCSVDEEPLLKVESETAIPILDKSIHLEQSVHPMICKYVKEIMNSLPGQETSFKYKDIPKEFLTVPDPRAYDYDIHKSIHEVQDDGLMKHYQRSLQDDLIDPRKDQYGQFAEQIQHHECPQLSWKENVEIKEAENRAKIQQELMQRRPEIKQTIKTRVRKIHLNTPVSLGNGMVGLAGHIPPGIDLVNARLKLIRDLKELVTEIEPNIPETSNPDAIQELLVRVTSNPLVKNLERPNQNATENIYFADAMADKNRTVS